MILVDEVLVSDLVIHSRFSCCLEHCRGACCQEGDRGSPVSAREIAEIRSLLPDVLPMLGDKRSKDLLRNSFFVSDESRFELRCLEDGRCVFAKVLVPGGPLACLLQKAAEKQKSAFNKPIFCHLFPLRIENYYGRECLNMEIREECRRGFDTGPLVVEYCAQALIRRFGKAWYDLLLEGVRKERLRIGQTALKARG